MQSSPSTTICKMSKWINTPNSSILKSCSTQTLTIVIITFQTILIAISWTFRAREITRNRRRGTISKGTSRSRLGITLSLSSLLRKCSISKRVEAGPRSKLITVLDWMKKLLLLLLWKRTLSPSKTSTWTLLVILPTKALSKQTISCSKVKIKTKIETLKVLYMIVKRRQTKTNIIPQDLIRITHHQRCIKITSLAFLRGRTEIILLVVEKQPNKNCKKLFLSTMSILLNGSPLSWKLKMPRV